MSEDQIVQVLVKQAESEPVGAFGEIGSWDYITKDERKVFRAVVTNIVLRSLPPKQTQVGLVTGSGMTVSISPSGR